MSKINIYIILSVLFIFFSCSKNAEFKVRQYPAIQTLEVSNIDTIGATLKGEILQTGTEDIIQYGFIYYPVKSTITAMYDTILVKPDFTGKGTFTINTEEKLSNKVTYNVKAYAKTLFHEVFGPTVEFTSMGSKYFPWDLYLQPTIVGYENIFTTSANKLGYLLMTSMEFYSFNPVTDTILRLKDYPGYTAHYAASFLIGDEIYIIKNSSSEFYKFQTDNNDWVKLNTLPFIPGDKNFTAFSINDQGYYLYEETFYQYNKSQDTWIKKNNVSGLKPISTSKSIGNNAYVLTNNKTIWKFSQDEDQWQIETTYPGTLKDKIINFGIGNNLYFGFSYDADDLKQEASSDFWQYSIESKIWTEIQSIPYNHTKDLVFGVSIDNYGYLGYCTSYNHGDRQYNIWKFSEEKITK